MRFGSIAAASIAVGVLATSASCGDDEATLTPASCDIDCTDQNPCTLDFCVDGACAYEPASATTSCDDDDLCNGESLCDGTGQCVAGMEPDIDDGNACTSDVCDPATGEVSHDLAAGCLSWQPLTASGAPSPRTLHTAIWTGDEMIVWGGRDATSVFQDGARYDPARAAWAAISTVGAPTARHSHTAVWTGDRMIVWGGYGEETYEPAGGVYDPATDTWTPISAAAPAPAGRVAHSAVWTGTEMIIWGGGTPGPLADGAAYNLADETWTVLPADGAPTLRYAHSAVWTGDRMVVWGGQNLSDWLDDGEVFQSGAWTGGTSETNAPSARQDHTAVWTGDRMVVWGGFTGGPYEDTGGAFDPEGGADGGSWEPLSTASAPEARTEHVAVWTGTKMFVFGGCGTDSCAQIFGDGGIWTPSSSGGQWATVAETAALSPRKNAEAVWTGNTVIVWGGTGPDGPLGTGAIAVIPD